MAMSAIVGITALAGASMMTQEQAFAGSTAKEGKTMTLEQKWDKTFPRSSKVDHKKVTFVNRYGITLVGDLYIP